jgi:hypothetical protein
LMENLENSLLHRVFDEWIWRLHLVLKTGGAYLQMSQKNFATHWLAWVKGLLWTFWHLDICQEGESHFSIASISNPDALTNNWRWNSRTQGLTTVCREIWHGRGNENRSRSTMANVECCGTVILSRPRFATRFLVICQMIDDCNR